MSNQINIKGSTIRLFAGELKDYISITDIAKYKKSDRSDDLIRNWIRNRNTIEFIGVWEQLNNPNFNPVEFDGIKKEAGLNSFTLMLTKISPLSLPLGFQLNSSFI